MGRRAKPLHIVEDDTYLRHLERRREQEARARDFARPGPAEQSEPPPAPQISPTVSSSPTARPVKALPKVSPTAHVSPTVDGSPKPLNPVEYRKGDSRINHDFFDRELSNAPPLSQLLWLHLNRYREAGGPLTVVLTWDRLAERIQKHPNSLRTAFKQLVSRNLASIERHVYGKSGPQGLVFRLPASVSPTVHSSPTADSSHKRKEVKDNSKSVTVCDLCKGMSGHRYVDRDNPQLGVVKCDHGQGK